MAEKHPKVPSLLKQTEEYVLMAITNTVNVLKF